MYTDFCKEDWSNGATVYLLCTEKGSLSREKKIIEGIVITVGRKYITVFAENKKIRFISDKELKWIYHPEYEVYLKKDHALNRLRKWDVQKEMKQHAANILFSDFKEQSLEQLEFLSRFLNGILEPPKSQDLLVYLSSALTPDEVDAFYRRIWTSHVKEDIRAFSTGENIVLSEDDIKKAASAYTDGKYDCNLSYWDNLREVIKEFVDAA